MPNYAGSINQLAANEVQVDAQQRASLERMLMTMIQQRNQARNNQQQDRVIDREGVRDAQQQQNWMQTMALRKAEGELSRRERAREFDATQQYRADALRENNRTRRMEMLRANRSRSEAVDQRGVHDLLPNVNQWAAEGGGTGPDVTDADFRASFPEKMWSYSGMAVSQARKAREALKQLYHADLADASALNEEQSYKNMLAAEKNRSWDNERVPHTYSDSYGPTKDRSGFWFGSSKNNPDPNATKEWEAEVTARAPVNTIIRADRDRMSRLTLGANGYYEVPALPWMSRLPTRGSGDSMPQRPAGVEVLPPSPPVDSSGAFAVPKPIIIENPTTGAQMILRNGRWEPL